MPRSRIFMLLLAALLIAQSALGAAWHHCHDGAGMKEYSASSMDNTSQHCHDDAAPKPAKVDPASASHGLCTCAIAHCAPALVSRFDFAPTPAHSSTSPLYHFAVACAPTETLLRPPTSLS